MKAREARGGEAKAREGETKVGEAAPADGQWKVVEGAAAWGREGQRAARTLRASECL